MKEVQNLGWYMTVNTRLSTRFSTFFDMHIHADAAQPYINTAPKHNISLLLWMKVKEEPGSHSCCYTIKTLSHPWLDFIIYILLSAPLCSVSRGFYVWNELRWIIKQCPYSAAPERNYCEEHCVRSQKQQPHSQMCSIKCFLTFFIFPKWSHLLHVKI